MSEYSIEFYTKPNGDKPAKEFIEGLEPKMRAKMLRELNLLEVNGPALREPSKSLGDGIFEVRAKFATNITRVLYFFYVGKTIVLTNGFVKKTLKTPSREIETARKYRADCISGKEKQ